MKYHYKKTLYFAQWISTILFLALMIALFYCIGTSEQTLRKMIFGVVGMGVFFFVSFSGEYFNRYVQLLDESARFNSFRFKYAKNAVSFNINYEDVISIETKKIPIIGIWAISVNAKNLPCKMTISFCFSKYRELYSNLCDLVKQHNPEVYIDDSLLVFCER